MILQVAYFAVLALLLFRLVTLLHKRALTHTEEWQDERFREWLDRPLPSPCETVGHEYLLNPDRCDWCGHDRNADARADAYLADRKKLLKAFHERAARERFFANPEDIVPFEYARIAKEKELLAARHRERYSAPGANPARRPTWPPPRPAGDYQACCDFGVAILSDGNAIANSPRRKLGERLPSGATVVAIREAK